VRLLLARGWLDIGRLLSDPGEHSCDFEFAEVSDAHSVGEWLDPAHQVTNLGDTRRRLAVGPPLGEVFAPRSRKVTSPLCRRRQSPFCGYASFNSSICAHARHPRISKFVKQRSPVCSSS